MVTLSQIEEEVAETLRFRNASPGGKQAVELAERLVSAMRSALQIMGDHQSATGVPATSGHIKQFTSHRVGHFLTLMADGHNHKYVFGVRVVAAHDIDVVVHVYLIPQTNAWEYEINQNGAKTLGTWPIGERPMMTMAHEVAAAVKDLAVAKAKVSK